MIYLLFTCKKLRCQKQFLFRLNFAFALFFLSRLLLFATLNSSIHIDSLPPGNKMSVQLLVFYPADKIQVAKIHLLEHLVAKGSSQKIDFSLESSGLYLSASTQDHLLKFAIDGNPEALAKALSALKQLLTPLNISSKELAKEINILKEEKEYSKIYNPESINASSLFDHFEELEKLSLIDLEALRKKIFQAEYLTLSISGPFDQNYIEKMVQKIFPFLIQKYRLSLDFSPKKERKVFCNTKIYSVPMLGLEDPESLAMLVAGLIISYYYPDFQLVYTPSVHPTYLTIYSKKALSIHPKTVNEMKQLISLKTTGIELACKWIQSFLINPSQRAYFMGILARGHLGLTPEKIILKLKNISDPEIEKALKLFPIISAQIKI